MKNRHRADLIHTEGGLIIAPEEPIDEGLRFTSDVVAQLAGKGVDIRALTRTPEKALQTAGNRLAIGLRDAASGEPCDSRVGLAAEKVALAKARALAPLAGGPLASSAILARMRSSDVSMAALLILNMTTCYFGIVARSHSRGMRSIVATQLSIRLTTSRRLKSVVNRDSISDRNTVGVVREAYHGKHSANCSSVIPFPRAEAVGDAMQ